MQQVQRLVLAKVMGGASLLEPFVLGKLALLDAFGRAAVRACASASESVALSSCFESRKPWKEHWR